MNINNKLIEMRYIDPIDQKKMASFSALILNWSALTDFQKLIKTSLS